MFRNPRDNVTRSVDQKIRPSVGRPPSPQAATNDTVAARSWGTMAVEVASSLDPPRLGTPNKSKVTPPKNSKHRPPGNSSILSFFKKANPNEENPLPEYSGLFVEERKITSRNGLTVANEIEAESAIAESRHTPDDADHTSDEPRFNESPHSVKRRKTSHPPSPALKEVPAKEAAATFDRKGCTPPPADFDDERNPTVLEEATNNQLGRSSIADKPGPFIDESDSEEEPEEKGDMKPDNPPSANAGFYTSDDKKTQEESNRSTEQEETSFDVERIPSLKREPTSIAEQDGFAGFEGMEDFEDEYENGEEYVERRYMREQRRLEAEAGIGDNDLDDEDFDDIQDGSVKENDMNVDFDSEENIQETPSTAVPSCPICSASFQGISDQDASIHVNNCLDGNPTPLPNPINTSIKKEESPSASVAKRFIRPPKPGQQSPFTLGQPSGTSSAFSKLMSGHNEETAWSAAAASERDSRGKPSFQRICPFYKILPGFYTCVDAFRYGAVQGCNAYFLSHFHSDHYVGLTSNWSHGKIYCSRITANLVRQQLRVDPKWVVDLEWEQKVEIPSTQGVHVTMIPANHCPGSSLFLFEKIIDPPKNGPAGARARTQRVLHCGDFRACPAHIAHPQLAPEIVDKVTGKLKYQKIDVCYLDTTYLNPRYAFPSQEDVITACADMCVSLSKAKVDENDSYEMMKRERAGDAIAKFIRKDSKDEKAEFEDKANEDIKPRKTRGPLLVVVGTYSIGKERICLGIARALDSLIYAPQSKQRICKALNDPELNKRLTLDPLAASVHMTPLFEIRAETLSEYLESYRGHFSRAVGFRPSGWNYRPPGWRSTEAPNVQQVLYSQGWKSTYSMKDLVPQRGSSNKSSVYGVPYSEHSSFRELSMFVCGLRIEKIIPTVNVGSAKSRERMRAWCERWSAEKRKNGLFRVKNPPNEGTDKDGPESEDSRAGEFYPGKGTWELRTTL